MQRVNIFFFKQKTAYEIKECDWSSDVCSSDLLQLAINSIELRHAFYGKANKQAGANTKLGRVTFQYAQYQYNSISKAVRILHEAVPQLIKFAGNRPENIGRLKYASHLLKHIQTTMDSEGKALKRGKVTLKEVNLLHGILMKVGLTAIMMQLGSRLFYGITNFQDPVGQVVYNAIDFLTTLLQRGDFDPGDDDDDRETLAWMIQDLALPLGMLYKQMIQASITLPSEGVEKTFFKGRVEDTTDFIWRVTNSIQSMANDVGLSEAILGSKFKMNRRDKYFFDMPWLIDDFLTGTKLIGWTPAEDRASLYTKRGLFYGLETGKKFPFVKPYVRVENRRMKSFGGGRYVETHHGGIAGFSKDKSKSRFSYLFDPNSYIPFLDKYMKGKTFFGK